MRCEYTFPLVCVCPRDGRTVDSYEVTVRTTRMVLVEDLLESADGFTGKAVFQEELTATLATLFGAEVETVGRHSGVKTRVTAGGPG